MNKIVLFFLLVFSCLWSYGQKSTSAEFTQDVQPTGDGWAIPNQKFRVNVIPLYDQSGTQYTPKGCTVHVDPVSENRSETVQKFKYQGKIIDFPADLTNKIYVYVFNSGTITSMKISVNINGVAYTKELTLYGVDSRQFHIPFNADLDDKSSFRITNFRVLDVRFDEAKLKSQVDMINNFNSGKSSSHKNSQTGANTPSNNSSTQTPQQQGSQGGNHQTAGRNSSQAGVQENGRAENSEIVTGAANVDIRQVAQSHHAAEKAKSDALTDASDQTFNQWKQGNYVQGAAPLANEFARQGSAAGAYGTVGVAVAAEIGSAIADARAAKKEREAAHAAYHYEVEQGDRALKKDAYEEALRWYYSSYQQQKNTLKSATHLGFMLMRGMGTRVDYAEALKFLNEAAEGYRSNKKEGGAAYFFLSKMYAEGLGVSKNPYKAFQMMQEAASRDQSFTVHYGYNGPEEAYYSLAFFHLAGIGTAQNFQKAYDMFVALMGADDNYYLQKEANLAMGVMYYYGLGLKKDVKKAGNHFRIAAGDGNSDALALIKKICDAGEVKGSLLEDLQKAYTKALPKRYLNRITNNTFGKFLKLI